MDENERCPICEAVDADFTTFSVGSAPLPLDSGKRLPDVGSMLSDPSSALCERRAVVALAGPLLLRPRVQMPDCYT